MAPSLTVADVERIAALAQLELTDEEKNLFTRQLAEILAYAEQLQAVDTSGVPATAHVNAHGVERAVARSEERGKASGPRRAVSCSCPDPVASPLSGPQIMRVRP